MTLDHIQDLISKAMVDLLYLHTTLGSVVINCHGVKVVENKDIPALAYTDGTGIYINKHYIDNVYEKTSGLPELTYQNFMFIIAHEASHLITLTHVRYSTEKDPRIWNQASDYAINQMLIENHNRGIEMPVGTPPEGALYNPDFRDKTAEEIYNILSKQASENNQIQQSVISKGKVKKVDQPVIQVDMHVPIDKDTAESIQCRVDDILSQHDFSTNNTTINRLFRERPVAPYPWKEVLSKYISSYIIQDYTWKLPSKISLATGFYLPAEDKYPEINIAIGIDTSMSIDTEDLNKFFKHLTIILASFEKINMEIHCFSTKVHTSTIKKYTEKDINTNLLQDFKLESHGGTHIASSFEYISKHQSDFDIYICMTDGEDDNINQISFNKTKVLWVITKDPHHNFTNPKGIENGSVIFLDN